jgi:hydrogenase maturation factor
MIASGSLLICAHPKYDSTILENLNKNGVKATKIGMMKDLGYGLKMAENQYLHDLPNFETDEIARFLSN